MLIVVPAIKWLFGELGVGIARETKVNVETWGD